MEILKRNFFFKKKKKNFKREFKQQTKRIEKYI